jgi:hypothetical protein
MADAGIRKPEAVSTLAAEYGQSIRELESKLCSGVLERDSEPDRSGRGARPFLVPVPELGSVRSRGRHLDRAVKEKERGVDFLCYQGYLVEELADREAVMVGERRRSLIDRDQTFE